MIELNSCVMEPSAFLRWIECHPATGSYIQAIFTVAAVVVALWLPILLAKREELKISERDNRRALDIAISASGYLTQLQSDANRVRHIIFLQKKLPEREQFSSFIKSSRITIPSRLEDIATSSMLNSHDVVWKISRALNAAIRHNAVVDAYSIAHYEALSDLWTRVQAILISNADAATDHVTSAIDSIRWAQKESRLHLTEI
jgi:hypothetical protein